MVVFTIQRLLASGLCILDTGAGIAQGSSKGLCFPSGNPYGLSAATLHELLPGARIWNVATDKWTPHLSRTRPSFSPLSYSSYSFIRACIGWKSANALQRKTSYFYGKQRNCRGGKVSITAWYTQRYDFKRSNLESSVLMVYLRNLTLLLFSLPLHILAFPPLFSFLTCKLLSCIVWGHGAVIIFSVFVISTSRN